MSRVNARTHLSSIICLVAFWVFLSKILWIIGPGGMKRFGTRWRRGSGQRERRRVVRWGDNVSAVNLIIILNDLI